MFIADGRLYSKPQCLELSTTLIHSKTTITPSIRHEMHVKDCNNVYIYIYIYVYILKNIHSVSLFLTDKNMCNQTALWGRNLAAMLY